MCASCLKSFRILVTEKTVSWPKIPSMIYRKQIAALISVCVCVCVVRTMKFLTNIIYSLRFTLPETLCLVKTRHYIFNLADENGPVKVKKPAVPRQALFWLSFWLNRNKHTLRHCKCLLTSTHRGGSLKLTSKECYSPMALRHCHRPVNTYWIFGHVFLNLRN
jgi:hypothetical protein